MLITILTVLFVYVAGAIAVHTALTTIYEEDYYVATILPRHGKISQETVILSTVLWPLAPILVPLAYIGRKLWINFYLLIHNSTLAFIKLVKKPSIRNAYSNKN